MRLFEAKGHPWALEFFKNEWQMPEDAQGYFPLFLPEIQASLISSNPALRPEFFQHYTLSTEEIQVIQAAVPLGTDYKPVDSVINVITLPWQDQTAKGTGKGNVEKQSRL